jgi:hypothetical protein
MREKVEKEKAGPGAAGKKETWKKKEILDILRDWGKVPGLFYVLRLSNYLTITLKRVRIYLNSPGVE